LPTIAHVLRPVAGGMLRHWQVLAKHSRQFGFITVAISSEANDLAALAGLAEQVLPLPLSASLPDRNDLRCIKLLRGYLGEVKPDLVHFHGFKAAYIGAGAGRITRPSVYTVHNYHPPAATGLMRHLYPQAERFIANHTQAIICVSHLQRQYLTEIPRYPTSKLRLIYNGIDPLRFHLDSAKRRALAQALRTEQGINMDSPLILTLARLIEAKGLMTLFEAIKLVNRDFPSAQFIIAGDGPEYSGLLNKAAHLNQQVGGEILRLVGEVVDPLPYYAAADLFVLPSWSEGLPLSILEAQAAGLAVVASAVGGIPEVIIPGQTGLLVPPKNPATLAEAICRLLADDNLRQRLAAGGQARTSGSFTEQKMVAQTYELYLKILS